MTKYLLFTFLTILLSGCFDKGDCLVTATNLMQVKLLTKADRKENKVKFGSVTVSGSNSILYKDAETATLLLPVDPGQSSTTFTLNYGSTPSTITVSYLQEAKVIAVDCGAFTYYKDLQITNTTYPEGSIKLFNTQLLHDVSTQAYANNVEVYF
jgi:3D (Asp-Asp-Asp) domain-containing protein